MSEQLEIIRLKKSVAQLDELNRKQYISIVELCCLLTEISEKVIEADSVSTKHELQEIMSCISNMIALRVSRATNYLYMPKADDVA